MNKYACEDFYNESPIKNRKVSFFQDKKTKKDSSVTKQTTSRSNDDRSDGYMDSRDWDERTN